MHAIEQLNAALAGRYTIDRLIGEGGMATVYLARDVRHQRNVALKVLKPDLGAVVGPERFLSEIQVNASLQHPNLLPLFDSGAAGNLLYFVMPYVDGESLRARINREKQLPIDEAVRIATAVASALDYAHRRGVIHRDLKPENILLQEGQPLVADFGIALAVSNAGGNRITQTGLSLGTPQYMSPEQAAGDRMIDSRTDIYSLGAVTYEMLTGEAPHVGTTSQQIIARLLTERPRPVRVSRPNAPEHVEAAVECALEKLPADRFATAKDFSETLAGYRSITRRTPVAMTAAAPLVTASRVPAVLTGRRPQPRELAAWALAIVGLAGAAALAIRARKPAAPLVISEFEVMLPDSLTPTAPASQAAISLSRDGSMVVFHGSRPGEGSALYARHLGDRSIQRIRGTDSARAPAISPDGSEVLFTASSAGSGPLRRVPIRGGTPRTVVENASAQYSWGGAGEIVYALEAELWIISANGGQPRRLASPDTTRGQIRLGWPDVLPGGKAALVSLWRHAAIVDSSYIGLVSIPDGRVTDLGIRGTYPRYSETGHVLFVTTDGVLNAVPFSLSSLRSTGPATTVAEGVRFGTGGAAAFSVARNGTLVYIGGAPNAVGLADLLAVSRSGIEREVGLRPGIYRTPRLSPDGRQITLMIPTSQNATAFGPLQQPDIWRYEIASKVLSRVTTDSTSEWPSWTPDGEHIAYVARDTAIMTRPLYATGEPRALVTMDRPLFGISIHRSGYVLFGSGRLGRGGVPGRRTVVEADVFLAHVDSGTRSRPLLDAAYEEVTPGISPDGRLLAYATNRTGQFEVYVRPFLQPGPEIRVSVDGEVEPLWSPDGRELFYRGSNSMMSARLAPGPRLAVADRDSLFPDIYARMVGAVAYDVFPSGREFVMLGRRQDVRRADAPLIVVVNWHAALRAPSADVRTP